MQAFGREFFVFVRLCAYNKFASMAYAYEQGDQDIIKAGTQTVFALAKVLGCETEVSCG
jgi:hypothetical protein